MIVLKYLLFDWKNNAVEVKEIVKPLEEMVADIPVFVHNGKPS